MLVLTRKLGESIRIDDHVRVTVVRVTGNRVTVGIEAPAEIPIWRGELRREWESAPADDSAEEPCR